MAEDEKRPPLDAVELKRALWDTLQGVKAGTTTPQNADAVASLARETLRTVRTQLAVFQQSNEKVSKEVIDFAKP